MGAFSLKNIVSTSVSDFGKKVSSKLSKTIPLDEPVSATSPVDPIYYRQGYEDAKAGNMSRRPTLPEALAEYNRGRASFQTGDAVPNGYMPSGGTRAASVVSYLPYVVGFAAVAFAAKKLFRRKTV